MPVYKFELEKYIKEKAVAIVNLHQIAIASGFISDGYDDNCLERATYALKKAGIMELSDIDEFANKNIGLVQVFFSKFRSKNHRVWKVTQPFLYELTAIFKEPSIFNEEYKNICNWDPEVAEMLDSALKDMQEPNF
ncbi:hypothetical protein U2129_08420 [Klebsiella pneumoniae]|uniref:hypothetical protein n=1 Tax=Klebsiella pneumoniae TaxID=573 RepID=UPI0011BF4859|nr:hypothetical protein [Klebsiella pneumoniae]MBK3246133.1 hypothetical protein [Klebsiella pneumoniae]MCJ3731599.1 hypothetical protein [Klebsiella pneumoniae]MCJ3791222.1 hypothetical protein [Klebsiella pneumoniae]MCJ3879717.1 hypothetical protein [Klebsiella pneumoniae]